MNKYTVAKSGVFNNGIEQLIIWTEMQQYRIIHAVLRDETLEFLYDLSDSEQTQIIEAIEQSPLF